MVTLVDALTIATTVVGTAMTASYFLQIAKILKTKSAKDLSLPMFVMFAIGLTLWLLYGIAIKNIPIVVANMVGVPGVYIILILIAKYGKR